MISWKLQQHAISHSMYPFTKAILPRWIGSCCANLNIQSWTNCSHFINREFTPLSCKIVPMRPKCPTQCFMILSITIEGFLRSMMIDNVRRDHISIKWRIHLLFHFLRSIATFSSNLLANGKHTDGLAGVDANLLHTSQRLRISSNMTWASANSSRPASFKRDINFAVGGWANCRCNLRSEAFFSESFAPRSRANTSKSISRRGRE